MSYVTGIVLVTAIEDSGVESVRDWLMAEHGCKLAEVAGRAGGNKHPEVDVWLAGINHLNCDGLRAVIRSAPWDFPLSVRLILSRQSEIVEPNTDSLLRCRRCDEMMTSGVCPECLVLERIDAVYDATH